ncbi:MAG: vanadium-dependent haloperoxidase [Saprospiraceae bacterium]|nr:vanadium-dependent haloperoxidase [Saprospiraceae bacterium]MBP7642978.1 vanadium-dependent haloperoxidase [Saprospiraceae bacterium]
MLKQIGIVFSIILLISGCKKTNPNFQEEAAQPTYYQASVKNLTDILVHDIFSPPVASRNYAYPCIAGYEVARYMDPKYKSLHGQISHMPELPKPNDGEIYCYPLASIVAFNLTAKKFIFSEDSVTMFYNEMMKKFDAVNMPEDVKQRSIAFGTEMSEVIKKWADGDTYAQTRSDPKFTVTEDKNRWRPTAPAYMDGIEPSWSRIRPLVMDSAQQFKPIGPTTFSTEKGSKFYKEAYEVYEVGKKLTPEQDEIARFWDCNPYKMNVIGHVMHATKKITPGGHWMEIAGIAARKDKADFVKTTYAYLMTSLGLFDGFISCWDEKYRSNLVRPETYINEHIDENWVPLLQTPPFPEHTSGHSVVSGAASTLLTSVFGENFAFADSTELEFGLPVRNFLSFNKAADEAAISRLYGGIHYMPAIEYGVPEGRQIAGHIITKIKLLEQ